MDSKQQPYQAVARRERRDESVALAIGCRGSLRDQEPVGEAIWAARVPLLGDRASNPHAAVMVYGRLDWRRCVGMACKPPVVMQLPNSDYSNSFTGEGCVLQPKLAGTASVVDEDSTSPQARSFQIT